MLFMKGNKMFPQCRSTVSVGLPSPQRQFCLSFGLDGRLSLGLGCLSLFSHTTACSSPRGNPPAGAQPPVLEAAGSYHPAAVQQEVCRCRPPLRVCVSHRVQVRLLEHGRPDPQRVRDALRDLRCPREPGLARGHQALLELAHHPPQVYVEGEFLGGCDVMVETYQSGELAAILEKANAQCLVSLSLRRIRRVRRLDRGTSLSGRLSQKAPAAAC